MVQQSGLASLIKGKWAERVVYLVLVPALLLYSLWLPPAQLGARLFHVHYPLITPDEGGVVPGPQGARLDVPTRTVHKRVRMAMGVVTGDQLASAGGSRSQLFAASVGASDLGGLRLGPEEIDALHSVPDDLVPCGSFYRLEIHGEAPSLAFLNLPVPYDLVSTETADLYGWDGQAWHWLPSHISSDAMTVRAELEAVPSLLFIGQSQPALARIGFGVSATEDGLPTTELEPFMITVGGLRLTGDGGVVGEIPPAGDLAGNGTRVLLSLSNLIDGVVRSDLVDNLIINEQLRKVHIQNIMGVVGSAGCDGVEIAYGGVDADLRPEFTSFISELSQALRQVGKLIAVRVDTPARGNVGWHTGAYDWSALGQIVDLLRVPAAIDPAAYVLGGDMDRLLSWATGEVSREKIDLSISTHCHLLLGGEDESVGYKQALGLLARDIAVDDPDRVVLPGQAVNLDLPDLKDERLRFDKDAQVYCLTYGDAETGTAHTIWLESAASVALPEPRFALVWTVEDQRGTTIGREVAPVADPQWRWMAPDAPGNYIIRAAVSDDGGETNLGPVSELGI